MNAARDRVTGGRGHLSQRIKGRFFGAAAPAQAKASWRPQLECLERRDVPATLTVGAAVSQMITDTAHLRSDVNKVVTISPKAASPAVNADLARLSSDLTKLSSDLSHANTTAAVIRADIANLLQDDNKLDNDLFVQLTHSSQSLLGSSPAITSDQVALWSDRAAVLVRSGMVAPGAPHSPGLSLQDFLTSYRLGQQIQASTGAPTSGAPAFGTDWLTTSALGRGGPQADVIRYYQQQLQGVQLPTSLDQALALYGGSGNWGALANSDIINTASNTHLIV
jgi:hypothetical protein